jgi:hypothetical protein
MKIALMAAGSLLAVVAASPAEAIINAPVPAANYITFGGNDWAWASPCPATAAAAASCGTGEGVDFSFQGGQGWRLPTLGELLAGPAAADFGPIGSFACASAYFTNYGHCDYNDAAAGDIYGLATADNFAETWVIRGAAAPSVPEPATWAMMMLGFGIAGFAMRTSRKPKVSYSAI